MKYWIYEHCQVELGLNVCYLPRIVHPVWWPQNWAAATMDRGISQCSSSETAGRSPLWSGLRDCRKISVILWFEDSSCGDNSWSLLSFWGTLWLSSLQGPVPSVLDCGVWRHCLCSHTTAWWATEGQTTESRDIIARQIRDYPSLLWSNSKATSLMSSICHLNDVRVKNCSYCRCFIEF